MKKLKTFIFYFIQSLKYHPKATIKMLIGIIKSIIMGDRLKYIYNMSYNVLAGAYIIMTMTKKEILLQFGYL